MPCKSLANKYVFIDKSDFEIILKTWSNTDKPPKPNKNAHRTIFVVRALHGTPETRDTPFVSSTKPVKIGFINEISILNNLKIGCNVYAQIDSKLLVLKIEIITENNTTKPPITSVVFMALKILFPRTSPKLDKLHCLLLKLVNLRYFQLYIWIWIY